MYYRCSAQPGRSNNSWAVTDYTMYQGYNQ